MFVRTEYVDEWESIEVGQERGYRHQRAMRVDIEEQWEGIKDLVSKGAVIAITSGDPREEYYLMKVTGNDPEVLDKMAEDDWSSSYPAGAEILRGLFYVSVLSKSRRRMYKLNKKKQAMVYAATARFICPEFLAEENRNEKLCKVSEGLHLDILGSLEGF